MSSKYTIGSFNIQKFNYESRNGNSKDFSKLAKIIRREGFDVIAIQEAVSDSAVNNLVTHLGKYGPSRWESRWEKSSDDEGYAFIWKTNRLRLVNSNKENPRIYRDVTLSKSLKTRGCISLVRPPYVGSFTPVDCPGGSNFQLRLINTHIAFNKPSSAEYWVTEAHARRNELAVLSEEIYRRVSMTPGGKLVPYTILLGDYNLVLTGNGYKIEQEIAIEGNRKLLTVQEEKTSLKQPKQDQNITTDKEHQSEILDDYSVDYYSRNYDHFSYESTMPQKMRLSCSRVDALEKYFNNDLQKYRDKISDHVPIKLIIDLNV